MANCSSVSLSIVLTTICLYLFTFLFHYICHCVSRNSDYKLADTVFAFVFKAYQSLLCLKWWSNSVRFEKVHKTISTADVTCTGSMLHHTFTVIKLTKDPEQSK